MIADPLINLVYILTSLECIEKIDIYTVPFTSGLELKEHGDQLSFNATIKLLEVIGEEIGKLSDKLKTNHSHIPWREIIRHEKQISP